jgi:hypothetical protein
MSLCAKSLWAITHKSMKLTCSRSSIMTRRRLQDLESEHRLRCRTIEEARRRISVAYTRIPTQGTNDRVAGNCRPRPRAHIDLDHLSTISMAAPAVHATGKRETRWRHCILRG